MKRYVEPPPPPVKTCEKCKVWRPDVEAPIGDGSALLCWMCAHMINSHGSTIELGCVDLESACGCTADDIYPRDVIAARHPAPRSASGVIYIEAPTFVGRDSDRMQAKREARENGPALAVRARMGRS